MAQRMLAVVMLTLTFGACTASKPLAPIPLAPDIETKVTDKVKALLKDPYSAQFEGLRAGHDDEGRVYVCGFVNAKNSYGGYVGRQMFAAAVEPSGEVVIHAWQDGISAEILCAGRKMTPAA